LAEARRRILKDWGDTPATGPSDALTEEQDAFRQFLAIAQAKFAKKPWTVFVAFWPADRDIGNDDEWQLSCEVPRTILDALIADLDQGNADSLEISFELEPGLSDAWDAPVSEGGTVGIPRLGKYERGSCHGWLLDLRWKVSGVTISPRLPATITPT